jgi:hypothetical protein
MSKIKLLSRVLLAVSLLAIVLILSVPTLRNATLLRFGALLVHADAIATADVIVIAVDGGAPEILEAVDLVHAGFAHSVWVFSEPMDEMGQEFARRGLPYADKSAVAVQTLRALGVPDAQLVVPPVDGSNREAERLPAWCREHQFKRVIFLVVADHSRRMKRMLERSTTGEGVPDIRVRYSRYAQFQPETWWTTRSGVRMAIIESEKLLLDVLNHP